MTDTTLISIAVTATVLLGIFILTQAGWLALVVYLIVLVLIFGLAG